MKNRCTELCSILANVESLRIRPRTILGYVSGTYPEEIIPEYFILGTNYHFL